MNSEFFCCMWQSSKESCSCLCFPSLPALFLIHTASGQSNAPREGRRWAEEGTESPISPSWSAAIKMKLIYKGWGEGDIPTVSFLRDDDCRRGFVLLDLSVLDLFFKESGRWRTCLVYSWSFGKIFSSSPWAALIMQRLSDEPDILVTNGDAINLGSFRAWWQVGLVLTQFGVTALNMDVSHLLKCFIKVKSKSRYLKMISETGKHNYLIILDEGRISKDTHASRIRKRSLWGLFFFSPSD